MKMDILRSYKPMNCIYTRIVQCNCFVYKLENRFLLCSNYLIFITISRIRSTVTMFLHITNAFFSENRNFGMY